MGAPIRDIGPLEKFVAQQIPEGVSLEYKRSDILIAGKAAELCKSVSAFANSVGGRIIFGVQADKGGVYSLDSGVPGSSKRDWIFQIINGQTHPPIETAEITEISGSAGLYYVVDVVTSPSAPHQSSDYRYYKRRGSHSEPMEDYEISDVRNRPKIEIAPLTANLVAHNQIAFLHFRNAHYFDPILSIQCAVTSNVEFERDAIQNLTSGGIRKLVAQSEKYFLLDSTNIMLEKNPESEVKVTVKYEFQKKVIDDSFSFYLADFKDSVVWKSSTDSAITEVSEKIGKLVSEVEKIASQISKLTDMRDASGLRLSQRTIASLKDRDFLFEPREFDFDGYQIVLGISADDAIELYGIFHVIDSPKNLEDRYSKLPADLRTKFESRFKVRFESES